MILSFSRICYLFYAIITINQCANTDGSINMSQDEINALVTRAESIKNQTEILMSTLRSEINLTEKAYNEDQNRTAVILLELIINETIRDLKSNRLFTANFSQEAHQELTGVLKTAVSNLETNTSVLNNTLQRTDILKKQTQLALNSLDDLYVLLSNNSVSAVLAILDDTKNISIMTMQSVHNLTNNLYISNNASQYGRAIIVHVQRTIEDSLTEENRVNRYIELLKYLINETNNHTLMNANAKTRFTTLKQNAITKNKSAASTVSELTNLVNVLINENASVINTTAEFKIAQIYHNNLTTIISSAQLVTRNVKNDTNITEELQMMQTTIENMNKIGILNSTIEKLVDIMNRFNMSTNDLNKANTLIDEFRNELSTLENNSEKTFNKTVMHSKTINETINRIITKLNQTILTLNNAHQQINEHIQILREITVNKSINDIFNQSRETVFNVLKHISLQKVNITKSYNISRQFIPLLQNATKNLHSTIHRTQNILNQRFLRDDNSDIPIDDTSIQTNIITQPTTKSTSSKFKSSVVIILAVIVASLIISIMIISAIVYFLVKKGYIKLPSKIEKDLNERQMSPSLLNDVSSSRR